MNPTKHRGTTLKLAPKINQNRTSQNLDFSIPISQLGHGDYKNVLSLIIACLLQSIEAWEVSKIFDFTP